MCAPTPRTFSACASEQSAIAAAPLTARLRRSAACAALTSLSLAMSLAPAESASAQDANGSQRTSAAAPGARDRITVKECRLKVRDRRELAAERVGIIAEVAAQQGETIRGGSILVRLKDDVVRATYETARKRAANDIEIRYAQKAKEVAYADLERALETNRLNPGTISSAEIEKLRLTAEKSDLQIEQAEHQMAVSLLEAEEAKAQLASYAITAPIHGRVSRVHKEVGEAVQQGEAILEIVNTDTLIAEGYISVVDLPRIRRGCFVSVTADGLDYHGHIIDVEEEATFVGARIKVFAAVRNQAVDPETESEREQRLIAGLTATMTIDPNRVATAEEIQNTRLDPEPGIRPSSELSSESEIVQTSAHTDSAAGDAETPATADP